MLDVLYASVNDMVQCGIDTLKIDESTFINWEGKMSMEYNTTSDDVVTMYSSILYVDKPSEVSFRNYTRAFILKITQSDIILHNMVTNREPYMSVKIDRVTTEEGYFQESLITDLGEFDLAFFQKLMSFIEEYRAFHKVQHAKIVDEITYEYYGGLK